MRSVESTYRHWLGRGSVESSPPFSSPAKDALEDLLFGFRPEESFQGGAAFSTPVDDAFFAAAAACGEKPAEFWPGGRPYVFCVSHDIDRILSSYHGLRQIASDPGAVPGRIWKDLISIGARDSWNRNPFFNFERSLTFEAELGIRSAYFVLFEKRRFWKAMLHGEVQHFVGVYRPSDIRAELARLEEVGHEIGLHASFDAWSGNEGGTRALAKEREELLQLGIRSVLGVRNHYLHYDSRRTAIAQVGARFAYDSTYGFNQKNGFRAGTSFPYRIDGIWELPFQLMDSALRVAESSVADRRASSLRILDRVRKSGGVFFMNWHLHTMNSEIFPHELSLYAELVSVAKRDGAWMALPREVIEHWSARGGA